MRQNTTQSTARIRRRIDGINLFVVNDDLKIERTCKITDVINVETPVV